MLLNMVDYPILSHPIRLSLKFIFGYSEYKLVAQLRAKILSGRMLFIIFAEYRLPVLLHRRLNIEKHAGPESTRKSIVQIQQ